MKHLLKVDGYFYFRMRTPKDLLYIFNMKEFKKSLHTKNSVNAKVLLRENEYQLGRLFTLARCGMLDKKQIESLVKRFFNDTLERYEQERTEGIGVPRGDDLEDSESEFVSQHHEGCKVAVDEGKRALALNDLTFIEPVVDEFLSRYQGYHEDEKLRQEFKISSIDRKALEFKILCREILKAFIAVHEVEQERILGRYDSIHRVDTHTAIINTVSENKKGILLSQAVKQFLEVKVSKKEFNQATVDDSMSVFNLLLQVVGDVDIKTLDKDAAIKFMTVVNKIPKNMNVMKQFKGKPVDEVLKIVEKKNKKKEGSVKLLSDSSRKKYVERASMLMKWCVDADYCDKNYFKNLAVKVDEDDKQKRRPFTREELLKLVQSPVFTDKSLPLNKAYQFFIPLIGLFAGMRMNEICQLYCEDIKEIDGVYCIDVNKNLDKKLKSKAARRIVPVHPVLIAAGLIEFKKLMQEEGNERMWTELKFKKENYKEDYSGEFNKYCDQYISDDKQVNFHVFRNTLSDNLKQQGISINEASVAAILGHKHPNITFDTYGQAYNPKPLLEVLMKLDYADVFEDVRFPLRDGR
jgi:integrase